MEETLARVDWPVATNDAVWVYPDAVTFVEDTAVEETEAADT